MMLTGLNPINIPDEFLKSNGNTQETKAFALIDDSSDINLI